MPEEKSDGIKIKNIAKLFTLLLLTRGDLSGYDIMKGIGSRLGGRASPGQVYPFLRQLKAYGYIETAGAAGERERQVYHLTQEGREFVSRLSSRFEDLFEMAIRPKLTTCAHCSCEIYRGAYREKIGEEYLSFCCKNCANGYRAMKNTGE